MDEDDPIPKRGEGRYVNCLQIGHNAFEFLFDFGQTYSDDGDFYHTRLVTTPAFASQIAKLLTEAIARYERTNGPISK